MSGIKNKDLKRRIIQISYEHKLSHIGSCMSAVDIIEEIYQTKTKGDYFILSAGHSALAYYCVLEKHYGVNAEFLFRRHGVHPNRDIENFIYVSTGSLGHGLPIGVGIAIADPDHNVYILTTDGELNEGSMWETLRFIYDYHIQNVKLYVNWNGFTAYNEASYFNKKMLFHLTINPRIYDTDFNLPFLKGIDAHYHIMTSAEYLLAMDILKDE